MVELNLMQNPIRAFGYKWEKKTYATWILVGRSSDMMASDGVQLVWFLDGGETVRAASFETRRHKSRAKFLEVQCPEVEMTLCFCLDKGLPKQCSF